MKTKSKGNTIAQYGIIIALIALGLIPLFFLIGKNLISFFEEFNQGLNQDNKITASSSSVNSNSSTSNINESIPSPDNPVKKCANNKCDVDFGEFVLKGIPENFTEIVQASGTSGGTEELLALIEQIAQQLEEKGDDEGAKEFRELANLGHFVADVELKVENLINSCETNGSYTTSCLKSQLNTAYFNPPETPENVKHLLSDFDMKNFTFWDFSSFMDIDSSIYKMKYGIDYVNVGSTKIDYSDDYKEATKFEHIKEQKPSLAIAGKYIDIMNNPKYSDAMKKVTTELVKNIAILGDELTFNASQQEAGHAGLGLQSLDWETGEVIKTRQQITVSDCDENGCSYSAPETVSKHEFSMKTDLNSALICSTGKNKDTGQKCH